MDLMNSMGQPKDFSPLFLPVSFCEMCGLNHNAKSDLSLKNSWTENRGCNIVL